MFAVEWPLDGSCVVKATIGISIDATDYLELLGRDVNPTWPLDALVDTGSEITVIRPALARALGLQPAGVEEIRCPIDHFTRSVVNHYFASVSLTARGGQTAMIGTLRVAEMEFETYAFEAIIGLDILRHTRLQADFVGRRMRLEIPRTPDSPFVFIDPPGSRLA
jgi:hypothetical protein